jgi:hypothetical protein
MFLPPLVVVSTHLASRRSHSSTDSASFRQRSQAAEQALDASRTLPEVALPHQPVRAVEIVSEYLRTYKSNLSLEPTPREVAEFLRSRNALPATIELAGRFFDRCAANRFAREQANHDSWRHLTDELISALEADQCLRSAR